MEIKRQIDTIGTVNMSRKESTRCLATCILPGCMKKIYYLDTDSRRPLYCPEHLDGREHRGYRDMVIEVPEVPVEHVFRCPRDSCARTSTAKEVRCPICGTLMIQHGEIDAK